MAVSIQVYSDYVCPFCYLAEVPLQQVAADSEVQVDWQPFELRPEPAPTLRPEGEYLQRAWRDSVYPLARELGVDIHLPPVSPQPHTRLAFEGLQFAKAKGRADAYNDAVFRAFFQEGRDIGDLDVLIDIANGAKLNGNDFRLALETGRYTPAHQEALQRAYALGISAVPAFVIGRRMLTGLPAAEMLRTAIQETMQRV